MIGMFVSMPMAQSGGDASMHVKTRQFECPCEVSQELYS